MTTAESRSPTTRRVLIADDDPTTIHLVTEISERAGYSAVTARDGREAFRILRSDCDFVAAVFDAALPHLSVSELIGYMSSEKRLMRIPVMILSDGAAALPASRAVISGASICLPKPFTSCQLRTMLGVLETYGRAATRLSAARPSKPPAPDSAPAVNSVPSQKLTLCHEGR